MTMPHALTGSWDLRLVVLSVLIAAVAAYAAIEISDRIPSQRGFPRLVWLAGGSMMFGIGIWAMHYIGMMALVLPVPVLYDWPTVLLSVLAAVGASLMALRTVTQSTTVQRGVVVRAAIIVGCGIAAMHYIGMEAMRLPAMCVYSWPLVLLSVVLAILLSYAGGAILFRLQAPARTIREKCFGALLLGMAVPVMHYVGMAAVRFVPAQGMHGSVAHAIAVDTLLLWVIILVVLTVLSLGVLASITDRRLSAQAEELVESRERLQAVFQSLREAVIVEDHEQILMMNTQARNMMGLTLAKERNEGEQIVLPARLDKSLIQLQGLISVYQAGKLLPPEEWPGAKAHRGIFLDSDEIEIHRNRDGKTVIALVNTAPVYNRNGAIDQVILTFHDITESRRMEESRVRLAAIVDSSEDAIIGKDPEGVVTSWNNGAEKVFGYTAEEMIGQSIRRLMPEDRMGEEEEILRRIKAGEVVDHIETVRRRKDGKFIHVSLTISPIRDSSGRIVGASKIARDISDRKRLESRLYESQKMEAMGQLTGGIAHDFNNLLGVIIGNLDLLDRSLHDNQPALKRVETALRAAMRGADLTRRLLAFSTRGELRPVLTSIEDSVRSTVDLASRAVGPGISIVTHFDPNLPPVFADIAGLESSLLNLIVNARDAMPNGGTVSITTQLKVVPSLDGTSQVGALKPGRYIQISVSDTGTGMSRETMERAFEPFFTTKPRGKGTGLGLAMVYGFFRQSGGATSLYSELGYGTTVSCYLPVAQDTVLHPPAPDPLPHPMELPLPDTARTILVVDDERDLLEVASSYLSEAGYPVLTARNGKEALETVAGHPGIAVLLTDIIMPGGMSGLELGDVIRELHPNMRVIYCSGFPSDSLADRKISVVDGPLLQKPYKRSELLAHVNAALYAAIPNRESQ